jgi:hypothetical protein
MTDTKDQVSHGRLGAERQSPTSAADAGGGDADREERWERLLDEYREACVVFASRAPGDPLASEKATAEIRTRHAILRAADAEVADGEARYVERHGSCPHKHARMKAEAHAANMAERALAAEAAREADRAEIERLRGALYAERWERAWTREMQLLSGAVTERAMQRKNERGWWWRAVKRQKAARERVAAARASLAAKEPSHG